MKKLFLFSFIIVSLSFISNAVHAQLYGVCVWEKKDDKTVYVSYVFEYKEDSRTGYSTSNTALKCSITNALKIEVGSNYKDYTNTYYLRKDRNMFYPYTQDEAQKLRTKLISEFREKDYSIISLSVTYDSQACD